MKINISTTIESSMLQKLISLSEKPEWADSDFSEIVSSLLGKALLNEGGQFKPSPASELGGKRPLSKMERKLLSVFETGDTLFRSQILQRLSESGLELDGNSRGKPRISPFLKRLTEKGYLLKSQDQIVNQKTGHKSFTYKRL